MAGRSSRPAGVIANSSILVERGYRKASATDLPGEKQTLYNRQRKSLVYRKTL
jgi:hypothetical protein